MILNRQRTVRVARPALESFLRRVRGELGLGTAEVTICLVSDAEIARMNESFRKKKGPTDVLSFPAIQRQKPVTLPVRSTRGVGATVAAAFRGGRSSTFRQGAASAVPKRAIKWRALAPEANFLGDIAISPATARRNAKKYGRTLPIELQILMLHGVLHLLGYDHETDRGQMNRIERRLRRRLRLL
jgi:probable rRNA maturation factor